MAIVKCRECGRDVSDQATACPHCGAPTRGPTPPVKKKTGCLKGLGIIFAVVFLGSAIIAGIFGERAPAKVSSAPASTGAPASAPTQVAVAAPVSAAQILAAKTPAQQACADKLIKARELHVMEKMEFDSAGKHPKIYVGETWYSIDVDTKKGFAQTVACFVGANQYGMTRFPLIDNRSGHTVAEYEDGDLDLEP